MADYSGEPPEWATKEACKRVGVVSSSLPLCTKEAQRAVYLCANLIAKHEGVTYDDPLAIAREAFARYHETNSASRAIDNDVAEARNLRAGKCDDRPDYARAFAYIKEAVDYLKGQSNG